MPIPNAQLEVGNEFGFIRSQMFKDLWKILGDKDKESIRSIIIMITTYAHAYLYKTILKTMK